ncbi:DUF2157 domain-containing protein [Marinicella rhabdoformis]|uniref:DUF2157 domain-containing protein n=1 Tax=Marinicella rhabdoformis TaxID=2580566 RepID=UPI0012AED562|nr:DUF2157 domain-containing protein [Marinicella rhabdoformis]
MRNEVVYQWIAKGLIDVERQDEAKVLAGVQAGLADWRQFTQYFLLFAGVIALASGVIFFFAFNWDGMSRFTKFALIQGALLVSTIVYLRLAGRSLLRQALLLMMALLIGAWLALVGQTYQTGADPWQLFAIWSLLIMPLVVVSRFEVMWVLLSLLLNLSLSLYQEVNSSVFGLVFNQQAWLFSFIALNAGLLMLLESLTGSQLSTQWLKLSHRWAAQLLAFGFLWLVLAVGMAALFDKGMNTSLSVLVFLITSGGFFAYYRWLLLDVALLALWSLMMVVVITAFLSKVLLDSFDDFGVLLVIGLAVIGMSVFAGKWLMLLKGQGPRSGEVS